jgi:pSer/pThr/pTyr-binding forkhead associated (FHA) protein
MKIDPANPGGKRLLTGILLVGLSLVCSSCQTTSTAPPRAARIEATLLEVKPDGSLGKSIPIVKEISLGRSDCDLTYPEDALLSPRHASLQVREGKLCLRDLGSQNGTFVRQRQDAS